MPPSLQERVLPRFVVIKSEYREKYLRNISGEESRQTQLPQDALKFSGDDLGSPLIKFEVEIAKINPEYVHIRSCHNHKYLVLERRVVVQIVTPDNQPVEEEGLDPMHNERLHYNWIVAEAKQKTEDTMFKPIKTNDSDAHFRFQHVATGHYAYLSRETDHSYEGGLCGGSNTLDMDFRYSVFRVIDWDLIVIFPKLVAFKLPGGGDKYLSYRQIDGRPYLQFVQNDPADETVANEITTVGDGYVRIKNLYTGKFWRLSPNWIFADSDDAAAREETMFWPVKDKDNIVALRSLKNNLFCKSLTRDGKTECLNACERNMIEDVKLEVVESVRLRSIYGINFRRDEAKIYDVRVVANDIATVTNPYDTVDELSSKFTFKKTSSSTFGFNYSVMLGMKTTLEVKSIPFIFENKIEFSAEFRAEYEWAKTKTTETSSEHTYTTQVKPRTKKTIKSSVTHAMCEVPFSYTQRDVPHDGKPPTIKVMNDGIYTGVSMYNVEFDVLEEDLPKAYKPK